MSKYDDIESAFRDKFDNDSISEQGWNMPRDEVWDKIEGDLSKEKDSRFGVPVFILLAALLFSLIGIGYVIHQNNELTKKVNDIKIELENCNTSTEKDVVGFSANTNQDKTESSLGTVNAELPKEKSTKNAVSNHPNTRNSELHNRFTHTKNINEYNITQISQQATESPESYRVGNTILSMSDNILNNRESKNIVVEPTELNIENRSENQILPLILNTVYPSSEQGNLLYPMTPQIPALLNSNSLNSFVTISGGIMGSHLIKNGKQSSALTEIIDKEYARLGAVLSLNYTSKISKRLSLSGGLNLTDQEFVTEYNLTLPYNTGEEIVENGTGHIDFEHSLPTAFGNTNTELRLRRSNTDQSLEEKNVDIDFNTKHRFVTLSAPLSIDYLTHDLQSGFYIGMDVVPSYIIFASAGIASVVSHHNKIESVNNASSSNYTDLKKINLALGGHVGYRYPVTQKSGLDFSARYLRNVDSYFSSGSFTSRSQGVQLSAGYYFRF